MCVCVCAANVGGLASAKAASNKEDKGDKLADQKVGLQLCFTTCRSSNAWHGAYAVSCSKPCMCEAMWFSVMCRVCLCVCMCHTACSGSRTSMTSQLLSPSEPIHTHTHTHTHAHTADNCPCADIMHIHAHTRPAHMYMVLAAHMHVRRALPAGPCSPLASPTSPSVFSSLPTVRRAVIMSSPCACRQHVFAAPKPHAMSRLSGWLMLCSVTAQLSMLTDCSLCAAVYVPHRPPWCD